jgi:hypothetical protein
VNADDKSAKLGSAELTEEQLEKIAGGPGGQPWTPRVS